MSASSGTTLISPTNTVANGPQASVGAASAHSSAQRKPTRTASHHAGHGHGHGHAHGHAHGHGHTAHHGAHAHARRPTHNSHSSHSSHSSRSGRRSSEGEHGRRALAAGLTMHVLEGDKPKTKRKTSEPHAAHTSHAHAHHARVAAHHHAKPSRSDTHLPRLADSPSSSSLSQVSLGQERPQPKKRGSKADVEVEVIAGPDQGDDAEWESGEETPAGRSKRAEHTMQLPPLQRVAETAPAMRRTRSSAASMQLVESPSDLPTPSPGHEPRETQRTTGFPGVPLTPASQPSGTVSNASQPGSRPASVIALSRPASHVNLVAAATAGASGARTPTTAGVSTGQHTGDMSSTRDSQGFPFPPMVSNGPTSEAASPARQTSSTTSQRDSPAKTSTKGVPSPLKPTHRRTPSASTAPLTAPLLRRPPSHASLRSMQSLRAPPHPLNSTGALDSPKQKRTASLHYPPAAPALVSRETVEGLGWEGDDPAPPKRMEPRPARVGSFSSVRSLKDLLTGGGSNGPSSPLAPTHPGRRVVSSATPSTSSAPARRLTAMQAATAVSRLGTTSDPVAYHQSLGFSPATAETAHLLSRFLPPKRRNRPRWAITTREALAAHHALEAGEEPPEPGRIGLTDGQYRDAHESLVATLRSLGRTQHARRGTAPRSYSYQSLLGATDELSIAGAPRREGTGMSPFEMSVARCLAQRPRV